MSESVLVTIDEPTDIAQARRLATRMATSLGFDEILTGEIAIVITEAGTNMLKHAGRGDMLLRIASEGPGEDLEMLALDRGPGMQLETCLADGYTTGSSPGQGLGAIQRLATLTDFYSTAGTGSVVLARWPGPNARAAEHWPLRLGAVNVPKKGLDVCGDSWGCEQNEDCSTILVADGLGHGPDANVASQEAVRMLRNHPDAAPAALLQLCHQALRSTRGAAVSIARVDHHRRQVTFAGVGNVMAQIYSGGEPSSHMVSVNGTAGHQVLRLKEFNYPWPENGMLIMYSDGLATGTTLATRQDLAFHHPSLIAGTLFRDFNRGLDDATVVVAKAA